MYRKFGEIWKCGFWDILAERQTNTHTHTLITILRPPTGSTWQVVNISTELDTALVQVQCTNYQRISTAKFNTIKGKLPDYMHFNKLHIHILSYRRKLFNIFAERIVTTVTLLLLSWMSYTLSCLVVFTRVAYVNNTSMIRYDIFTCAQKLTKWPA